VNELVNNLTKDWAKEVNNIDSHPISNELVNGDKTIANSPRAAPDVSQSEPSQPKVTVTTSEGPRKVSDKLTTDGDALDEVSLAGTPGGVKPTSSCPPGRVRSKHSGPWSLEWVHRHQKQDSDTLFVSKVKNSQNFPSRGPPRVTKKKGSGHL